MPANFLSCLSVNTCTAVLEITARKETIRVTIKTKQQPNRNHIAV